MQLVDETPARWEGIIADLTAKSDGVQTEIGELTKKRDALALYAELGVNGAPQKLQKLQAEITGKQIAKSTIYVAIQQAREKLAQAKRAEAAEAEKTRLDKLQVIFQKFVLEAQAGDVAFEQVARRLALGRALLIIQGAQLKGGR
jgi:hypothetical protein